MHVGRWTRGQSFTSLFRFGRGGFVCGESGSKIRPSISSAKRNKMFDFAVLLCAVVAEAEAAQSSKDNIATFSQGTAETIKCVLHNVCVEDLPVCE